MPVPTSPVPTARLDLVPLRAEHAEEMATVLADPALHRFIGGEPLPADALRTRYERLVSGSDDPAVTWHNWVLRLRADAALIGTVQATVTPARYTAEIAWITGTPWQGHGYASEAARALVTHLIRHYVRTITAHIHPSHSASAAVARAAGLSPTTESHEGETLWRLTLSTRQLPWAT
ncbi:GNAT family N-acetyltransferase [Streptomyces sp. NPDC090106]|uniref:GNAT family N-acetyltransferase n=1 Tax=Streptomyces sp. NPDC090106 TaxID=3365946 RepID=UPI0037FBBCF1